MKNSVYNTSMWKKAMSFHLRHRGDLFLVFPLLLIPLWTDCYHSVLVQQEIKHNGNIYPLRAIGVTMKLMPLFIENKIKFYIMASLWGFIPFVGWYKGYRYRLKWAMISNVMVFEKQTEKSIYVRCDDLADAAIRHNRTDALFFLPILYMLLILTVFGISTALYAGSELFFAALFLCFWIGLPCSALVNTFVYLSLSD